MANKDYYKRPTQRL